MLLPSNIFKIRSSNSETSGSTDINGENPPPQRVQSVPTTFRRSSMDRLRTATPVILGRSCRSTEYVPVSRSSVSRGHRSIPALCHHRRLLCIRHASTGAPSLRSGRSSRMSNLMARRIGSARATRFYRDSALGLGRIRIWRAIVKRRYITIAEATEYLKARVRPPCAVNRRWGVDRLPDGPATSNDSGGPQRD